MFQAVNRGGYYGGSNFASGDELVAPVKLSLRGMQMGRRRYAFDEATIARRIREERGTGHGADYRPWLSVQDVSSLGRSTRIASSKTGRQHHFLSDLETGLFLLLEWDDEVTDIREQFPLDRDATRMLAAKMGIVHPRDTHTQTDIVMTTDVLVDVRHGDEPRQIALSVKPSSQLEKPRTLEKQELERRYWQRAGIAWYLVTEHELPNVRVGNLRWLHEMQSLDDLQAPHVDYWPDRCVRFLAELARARGGMIEDLLRHLEANCGFAASEPMMVLRHLAATKQIGLDLDREFSSKDPVEALSVVDRRTEVRKWG
jgi:hypothetical protein